MPNIFVAQFASLLGNSGDPTEVEHIIPGSIMFASMVQRSMRSPDARSETAMALKAPAELSPAFEETEVICTGTAVQGVRLIAPRSAGIDGAHSSPVPFR
jgi:hypothetical protein